MKNVWALMWRNVEGRLNYCSLRKKQYGYTEKYFPIFLQYHSPLWSNVMRESTNNNNNHE